MCAEKVGAAVNERGGMILGDTSTSTRGCLLVRPRQYIGTTLVPPVANVVHLYSIVSKDGVLKSSGPLMLRLHREFKLHLFFIWRTFCLPPKFVM